MANSPASLGNSDKSNSIKKFLCLFLDRIHLLFGIMHLHQTKKGIVGAFQECAKANRGYLEACFQLRKASSSIFPGIIIIILIIIVIIIIMLIIVIIIIIISVSSITYVI